VETAERIEAAAARWLARRDAGPLDAAEAAAFEDWCAGDPRRLGAYVRLEAVAARMQRAGALNGMPAKAPPRAWFYPAAGIAAALALALWPASGVIDDFLRTERYATDIGEQYRTALPDGSLVELNTATKVAVDLTPEQRDIRLAKGEAVFEVAKDPKRPFVVKTPLGDVRAIGTVFAVRSENGLEVAVSEGVVAVERDGKVLARVAAGETFALSRSGDVAWREGKVAFAGETLAEAVAELNRYNKSKVEIADPEVASIHVGGYFRATDPAGFARALEKSFPVVAEMDGDDIVLKARPPA
jgi:transmembrane sensor